MLALTQGQLAVIEAPTNARLFLSGPAGCGKTTVGVARMLYLLAQGIPADALLVLAPQRTLAAPYVDALRQPG
ncbi:MAG: ATP-dependent DNA helicase PcrA, partial [Anaerolineae bacterium CG_4_8_14_3_um_filter_59_70]